MWIGGIQWTTLLDYPGRVATTVFTAGCNFRCPFCHNPELVLPERVSAVRRVLDPGFFSELGDRRGFLDGVVISGGEPTVQPDLPDTCAQIKALGYLVKLDTNGTMPEVLASLLRDGLVDYVAMDIKAPLDAYSRMAGTAVQRETIERSIDLIRSEAAAYEFRTTVAPGLSGDDLMRIADDLDGARAYWLQRFTIPENKGLVDGTCLDVSSMERSDLESVWHRLRDRFESGGVRG
jgi:pyruvate formate lyase activating enzyme